MKNIIQRIRETITAERELWEMRWRYIRYGESFSDSSYDIAMRYMRKRGGIL